MVFALGIIGTGLLAVPVLAGSAAYALAEARGWPNGLARKPRNAKAFYGTIAIATLRPRDLASGWNEQSSLKPPPFRNSATGQQLDRAAPHLRRPSR
jgi:hypothetical protein